MIDIFTKNKKASSERGHFNQLNEYLNRLFRQDGSSSNGITIVNWKTYFLSTGMFNDYDELFDFKKTIQLI